MSIASNLKAYRQNRRITQPILAKILGVNVSTLGKWETGKQFPRSNHVEKITDLLDTDYRTLIEKTIDFDNGNSEQDLKLFEHQEEIAVIPEEDEPKIEDKLLDVYFSKRELELLNKMCFFGFQMLTNHHTTKIEEAVELANVYQKASDILKEYQCE